MIIKEIYIEAFGGLENKRIRIESGFNIIYGENEKGKSTLESFIKCMLYGLQNKRGKGDGERKKYLPFNGGAIKGSLKVENNGREYIIQRIFGQTRKEDSSIVIDSLTGEEVKNISYDEPGKSFLGINRQTFERTLFISQLGVAFSKDKDEEIMDKITSLFGCSKDEVPVMKAIEKLENAKKTLTTTRGVGKVDLLKKRYSELAEERYDGYKLVEQNLVWENELIEQKEKRDKIRNEINKLEVYKKYVKKINLQKEYKDITEYLRKSQELKRREKEIENDLGGEVIDDTFIDELKEENRIYLSYLDKFEELKIELKELENIKNKNKSKVQKYKFLELFGDDIKDRLISLKYEQQTLKDKIGYMDKINSSIILEEDEISKKKLSIGKSILIKEYREEITSTLLEYEETLRKVKDIIEKNHIDNDIDENLKKESNLRIVGAIISVLGLALLFLKLPLMIVGIVLAGSGVSLFINKSIRVKELIIKSDVKREINILNKNIDILEEKLNDFLKKLGLENYEKLVTELKRYNSYKDFEERTLFRIEEKRKMINEDGYFELKEKFNKNSQMINSLIKMSDSNNVDDVIEKINIYNKLNDELDGIETDILNKKASLNSLENEILEKETKIKKKLEIMNLDLKNLLDLEVYIKEYKEKIKKHDEIHSNLISMEETYKALLKDRDIDAIREELKDIINESNGYGYQSEEEIEVEEKKRSNELIECEKKIKDLENSINNRMIGKRNLVEIEEEILLVKEKIKNGELKIKALDIAISNIKESSENIRREVGPAINQKITENFMILTNYKYSEVKLNDNYDMVVNDSVNLFKGNYLSNGAFDQLYLALRLAFIEFIFKNERYPLILDDAFIQYDDNRTKNALNLINNNLKGQKLIFTCQKREEEILRNSNIKINKIEL